MQNLVKYSDTDAKLLITLCTEMTADDACIACGVSYPYGIKRIGYLKKHGWLIDRVDGKRHYYSTRLTEDTEPFFAIAQTATSKGPIFRLQNFFGQSPTIAEAIRQEVIRTQNLKGGGGSLPRLVGYIVNTIRYRSYRNANGEQNQLPDEQMMRELLEQYIIQTKRNLKLAEEVLNTRKLWDGSPTTWKWLHEDPPGEEAAKQAQLMFEAMK